MAPKGKDPPSSQRARGALLYVAGEGARRCQGQQGLRAALALGHGLQG